MRKAGPLKNLPPDFTPQTVFFIGNGVLRVPSWIGLDPSRDSTPLTTPSWSEYMDQLWDLVRESRSGTPSLLTLRDFSRLSAPRQAEWFDRYFHSDEALSARELSALRLHLLGIELHPIPGLLTNDLLLRIGRLVAQAANQEDVDVFTTNLDCSLEQNIAWAIEELCRTNHIDVNAEIEVIAGFRSSVVWKRYAAGDRSLRVRLWKIHGCLRDLKYSFSSERWERLQLLLASHREFRESRLTADPMVRNHEFCGCLPEMNRLTPELEDKWFATLSPDARRDGENPGIFSITEYFQNLGLVTRLGESSSNDTRTEQKIYFDHFIHLLKSRSLLLLGYGLLDEDVDIVYLLHTYQSPRERTTLVPSRMWDQSSEARIEQMGIRSWTYEVEAAAFCLDPGRLRLAARHEWRRKEHTTQEGWRTNLQRVRADAWLRPQRACLDQLLSREQDTPSVAAVNDPRLVFAGLASIWHAFAMRQESDFPERRRVSANYTSVDAQVPGGSGLVPCMAAAAMAGPNEAGRLCFLTNVPRAWGSWPEIEEFCLSAGVDVHPLSASGDRPDEQIGRTSYVLLWNLPQTDTKTPLPKQRFIFDVPSLADEELANRIDVLRSPKACVSEALLRSSSSSLMFADKETDFESLCKWQGPVIFETGASGIELLKKADRHLRPCLWTSGVGSFLRTLVGLTACLSRPASELPESGEAILALLDREPRLTLFMAAPETVRRRYIAKLVSFNRPAWKEDGLEGFLYSDELDYGRWLMDHWWDCGAEALRFLIERDLLGAPHEKLGRGLLTTIHEGGLMGAWSLADESLVLVRVSIESSRPEEGERIVHSIVCEAQTIRQGIPPVIQRIQADLEVAQTITLRVQNCSQVLPIGSIERWNTLAAGDTVRGALAYGLWAYCNPCGLAPRDIQHVLLASATLATMKCYAGSFINFMRLLEGLRTQPIWPLLWGAH